MNTGNFFFCYNRKIMLELKSRGFKFLFCALHETTNNKFWLFERTEELSRALNDIN